MPQCRRGRHKYGKRTQGPDDGGGGWARVRDVRIAHDNERAGHRLSVQLFPEARLPQRPSVPGFPVIRADWTRIGPPEAPKWSNLHEWSREGVRRLQRARKYQPVIGNPRSPQLKPPTTQRGRRLFSCAGHSLDTSRAPPRRTSAASATRWISTPSKPSHQDPRRVHPWPLCPNSCTYAAPQAHAPIKSHRIRKARPSTLIHHFPRRDQAEPVCCGLPACHKYVAHGSLPYFQR